MQATSDILRSSSIDYRTKKGTNSIDYRTIDKKQSSVIVDKLLEEYGDIIDPNYKQWFAARFYILPFDQIHRAASMARQEGNNSQKYFSHLIKKAVTAMMQNQALQAASATE